MSDTSDTSDTSDATPAAEPATPERIDIADEAQLHAWAKKLDATPEQLKEAVAAVGGHAGDVEMHLKGSRSTSNSDKVAKEL